MKMVSFLGVALVVVCAGGVVLLKQGGPRDIEGGRSNVRGAPDDRVAAAAAGRADPADDSLRDEIEALRAQLRGKDELLKTVVLKAAAAEQQRAEAPAAARPPPPQASPALRACDLLDERMFAAPADPGEVKELERQLHTMVEGGAVGAAKVSALQCGGKMCKVTFSSANQADLNSAVEKVAERTPKGFAGTAAYAYEPGALALYIARDADDLTIPDDPAASRAN